MRVLKFEHCNFRILQPAYKRELYDDLIQNKILNCLNFHTADIYFLHENDYLIEVTEIRYHEKSGVCTLTLINKDTICVIVDNLFKYLRRIV